MQVSLRPIFCLLALSAAALLSAHLVIAQPPKLFPPEKLSDGIVLPFRDSFLKVEVCTDSVIHVVFAKDRAFFTRKTLAAAPKQCEATSWKFTGVDHEAFITTAKLKIKVDLYTGRLSFCLHGEHSR